MDHDYLACSGISPSSDTNNYCDKDGCETRSATNIAEQLRNERNNDNIDTMPISNNVVNNDNVIMMLLNQNRLLMNQLSELIQQRSAPSPQWYRYQSRWLLCYA